MTTTVVGDRLAPPGLAAQLAEFARGLGRDAIGDAAAAHAALLLLDAVGCALAGWAGEETPQVLQAAQGLGRAGTSTVIGSHEQRSPLAAVLANAYLATAITACDVYTPAHCHFTPEVVPAALAVAEEVHASGPALLTAVAAGLEVATRLARALDYGEFRQRGWHSPGVIGPVGAAVAAGKLAGLDTAGLRTAMSLAVSQAAGTFAAWPTAAVKFHQARGAAAGLLAARLAGEGFTAGVEPFEAPDGGLFASYSPGDPAAALAGLGREWELEQISVRLWPGATPIQALLTALLDGGPRPAAADLVKMEIAVPPSAYEAHLAVAHPAGSFEALLSFHYVAATVIRYGRFDIDLVTDGHIGDPGTHAFIDDRIIFRADPAVPRGGIRVAMTTLGSETVTACRDQALGTPANPATPAQVHAKFSRAAAGRLGSRSAQELLGRLTALDTVSDGADLLALTRPEP